MTEYNIYKSKYKKVGVLPIQYVFLSVSRFMFLSDEGPTLETLDFTIRIGSTRTTFIIYVYRLAIHELRSTTWLKQRLIL